MAAVEAWANSSLMRAASISLASCVTRLASRSAVYKNSEKLFYSGIQIRKFSIYNNFHYVLEDPSEMPHLANGMPLGLL